MAFFDRIGEFDPTLTYALDTTKSGRGAPGLPGEIRFRVHPSGAKYGLQGYRLLLNVTGGTVAAGVGVVMGEDETAGYSLAATAKWGAALTTPVNLLGGVAAASTLDNYWGWFQVYGITTLTTIAGNTVDGAKIETAASGLADDTVGTGVIIGVGLATGTSGASVSAFLSMVSPR